jgi:outer membrane protein assembly factor BamB
MTVLSKLSVVTLLIFSLSACGMFGSKKGSEKEPAALIKMTQERNLTTTWSAQIGDGFGENYLRLVLAIDNDLVFAVDATGKLAAFDKLTGKRVWKQNLKTPVSGGVGVGFERTFVATTNGEVIALDQKGLEVWRANVTSEVVAAPQTNGQIVVVQTLDEKIYAFEHETGEHRWTYESILPKLTLRGTSTPIVATDYILAGFANGKIVILDPETGRVYWEKRLASPQGRSELDRMIDVDGTPLVAEGVIYATSFHGKTAAINLRSSKVIWEKELSSFLGPDESLEQLFVVDENDFLHALDKNTGETIWRQESLQYRGLTDPVVYGNYVVVGDKEGYLHVILKSNGHFVARKKIDSDGLRSKPVSYGGQLYIYSNSGKLVALSLD